MPCFSGQLATAAAAQRLSNVYGGASVGNAIAPALDVPCRQVLLQAETADVFLGGDALVTSSVYGTKVDSSDNQPVVIGPFDNGGIKLSDLWVAGAGATVHVTTIPF